MTPNESKMLLRKAMQANRPVFMRGAPGIGKSAVVWQVAKEMDLPVIEVRATLIDPVDLRGIPTIDKSNGTPRTVWARPSFLPETPCILFFDEMNAAPPMVQASLYQVMLLDGDGNRAIGEHILHPGTRVIGAGNREEDNAVVQQMPSPLRIGRMIMIDLEVSLDDFIEWGLETGQILPEVLAFVRFRPALLHAFDADADVSPAPRSYQVLSDMLKVGMPPEIEHQVVTGILGEAAAAEFVGFLRIFRQLPMPEECIAAPGTTAVPDQPAACYAISAALAARTTMKNFNAAMEYMERLSEEYQVLYVRDATHRLPDLQETSTFITWGSEKTGLILGDG